MNDALVSLLESGNTYIIKLLVTNNLVSIDDLASSFKDYCEVTIDNHRHYQKPLYHDLTIELANLFIDMNVDVAILQIVFSQLIKINEYSEESNIEVLRKLLEHGVIIPADPEVICLLPTLLFLEYISLNYDTISTDIELGCAKYKEYHILEYVQDILESKGITLTDPLVLFTIAFKNNNYTVIDGCLQKINYDKILLNKLLLMVDFNRYEKIFNNEIISAELTLLVLIYRGREIIPDYLSKYLDPDVIGKYGGMSLYTYFEERNVYREFYCDNEEAREEYVNIRLKTRTIILNDDVYENLIKKAAVLLNVLNKDKKLTK